MLNEEYRLMAMIEPGRDTRANLKTQTGHAGNHSRQPTTQPQKVSGLQTGTVKWFNDQKKFGYIVPDAGGKEVFVHLSAIQAANMPTLVAGQKIRYEMGPGKDSGQQAATNLSPA